LLLLPPAVVAVVVVAPVMVTRVANEFCVVRAIFIIIMKRIARL